jgi:hypothetical protein
MRRGASALVLLAIAAASCGDSAPNERAASYAGLCDARDAAAAGDLSAAAAAFDHGPLHDLASRALEVDRGLGARLLEAKEDVESTLADETSDPATAARKLDALAEVTREAQRATDALPGVLPDC